jgi:hypothetical protein
VIGFYEKGSCSNNSPNSHYIILCSIHSSYTTINFSIDKTITPSSKPTPSIPEFPTVLAITFLVVVTLAVAFVIKRKTNSKQVCCSFWNNPFIVYGILILSMGNIDKSFPLLLLIILAVSSLILAESASAQSTPKPSVPEFTVKLVAHPYDIAPSTTTDPYTGKTTTQQGYHVENKSIEITIKNQPYVYSYNGSTAWLDYYIRVKGHFEDNWTILFNFNKYELNYVDTLPHQSASEFTVISIPANNYPSIGEVDFQVEALSVYKTTQIMYPHIGTEQGAYYATVNELGQESGWSNTQTITIPESSTSSTPTPTAPNYGPTSSPTPTPTIPEFSLMIISPLLLLMLSIAVISNLRRKRQDTYGQSR